MRVQGRREKDAEPRMDLRLQPLGGRGGWEVKREEGRRGRGGGTRRARARREGR